MNGFVRRVARNSIIFLSSQVWEGIAALGVVAILTRYLGRSGYGEYATVFAIVNFVVPLTFMGILQVGVREIARKETADEKGECLGSLLQARFILLGIAAIIIGLMLYSMKLEPRLVYSVAIFFLAIILGSSGELINSSFFAGEKFQYHLYVISIERISLLALIGIVAVFDLGFYAIFIAQAIAKALKASAAFYFLNKYFYKIVFKPDLPWVKRIIKESYLYGLGISLGLGLHHVVVIILNRKLGDAASGIFAAYYNIILRLQMFSVALSRSLMPRIAREARENHKAYIKLTRVGILIEFAGGFMLALAVLPFRNMIISILYGRDFLADISVFTTLILLLPFLFVDNILNTAFVSKGLARSFFSVKVVSFVLGTGIVFIFSPLLHIESATLGIATGKLAATLIMLIIFAYGPYRSSHESKKQALSTPPMPPGGFT